MKSIKIEGKKYAYNDKKKEYINDNGESVKLENLLRFNPYVEYEIL